MRRRVERQTSDRRSAAIEDLKRAGGSNAPVEIVDYNPAWPAAFEAERERLAPLLQDVVIYHFGSTAVPGLAAKPVIDMIALVDELDAPIKSIVADAGYQFPVAFNATLSHRRFLCYPTAAHRTHHLHLVDDRGELERRLRFRDRLRADPDLAAEYAALKRRLAEQYREDREAYTEAKAAFIKRLSEDDSELRGLCVDRVVVMREGEGPDVLLVHGGASPGTTWSGLESLKGHWTLASAYRRGFPPSPPPPDGHQDFDVDATDIELLLDRNPHVVAHSYGALGALIAATRKPVQVRSLTLIEPPLFSLLPDDPEVRRFQRMGDEALARGLDSTTLREFLQIAGSPVPDAGPLPENVVQAVRRAHGSRSPSEARPALDVLRSADTPVLVASGDHASFLERVADALAAELCAQRLVAPGAGHFVAAAPGFAERLEHFLVSAG